MSDEVAEAKRSPPPVRLSDRLQSIVSCIYKGSGNRIDVGAGLGSGDGDGIGFR